MATLLCAMMIVMGCTVVLFPERTIGLLFVNNTNKLCALVCRKIAKSTCIEKRQSDHEYIITHPQYHLPSNRRGGDVFLHYSSRHRLANPVHDKPSKGTNAWAISDLFWASWIKNCLLGCRSRAKLIHDIGRLAPRLSGGIHLTTLTTR